MASVFKSFVSNDITSTRTLLHEAIPITGAIFTASYGTHPNENNIKNFNHGMYQSVYDYPYLSSSANHIFDITLGYSKWSQLSSSTNVQNAKKINIYNQMAQILMGTDYTGSILQFDEDGNILAGGIKMNECIFIQFSRLLFKDEIKKGSFVIRLMTAQPYPNPGTTQYTITDAHATNDFRVNSPIGEYSILTASAPIAGTLTGSCGLLFYQAGICVLTASVFGAIPYGKNALPCHMETTGKNISYMLTGSEISASADAIRHRIDRIDFNNTTELNSTIYFVRANHNDFNYSSNPTYLSESKIRVKNSTLDEPVSYITQIGMYSSDNELLAVAKLSEPLKKTPSNEIVLRVRLDY